MFGWRKDKAEKDYYRTKHARDLEQRYQEARESDIRLLKSERAYSRNIEALLGRYSQVEEDTGVTLDTNVAHDSDYSDMLSELASEYVSTKYSSKVGNVVKDVIKSNKDEINSMISMFINQQVEGFMKKQGGKPAEQAFLEKNK